MKPSPQWKHCCRKRLECRPVNRSSGTGLWWQWCHDNDDGVTRGWKLNAPFPATDRRTLQELNLPKENFLYLLTPEIPPILLNGDDKWAPNNIWMYVMLSCNRISVISRSRPTWTSEWRSLTRLTTTKYTISPSQDLTQLFRLATSSMRIKVNDMLNQVKRDVATVTDIPVFRQSWTGGTLTIVNVYSKQEFFRLARKHQRRAVPDPDWSGEWLYPAGQPGEKTRQTRASGGTQNSIFDNWWHKE